MAAPFLFCPVLTWLCLSGYRSRPASAEASVNTSLFHELNSSPAQTALRPVTGPSFDDDFVEDIGTRPTSIGVCSGTGVAGVKERKGLKRGHTWRSIVGSYFDGARLRDLFFFSDLDLHLDREDQADDKQH